MNFDKKRIVNFCEFIVIFCVFVLPPLLNNENFNGFQIEERVVYSLLWLIFRAFFEEALYRFYLPYSIKNFYCPENQVSPFCFVVSEILPILLFALAHRYLGWGSVLYAFFMGGVFRALFLFLQKRISPWLSFVIIGGIHSLHNILVIFFILP